MALNDLTKATREVREFAKVGLRDESAGRRFRLLERSTVLRELPAVQAAGGDSTAQFAYLAQAIVDAIDQIDAADGSAGANRIDGRTSGHGEAQALRHLFGLTEAARWKTWRLRQELAAASLHVSWGHFRHHPQESLLSAVAERLLASVRSGNNETKEHLASGTPIFRAYSTQQDIESAVTSYIANERPTTALMLELSAATVQPILLALRDVGATVRLLVCHPEIASAEWQKARIRGSLAQMLRGDFANYQELDLGLYRVQPSLRGRCIGNIVTVGWYTHRDNQRQPPETPDAAEVWGHDNAMVAGYTDTPDGEILASWFTREFDRLWSHRLTCKDGQARLALKL